MKRLKYLFLAAMKLTLGCCRKNYSQGEKEAWAGYRLSGDKQV